MVFTSDDEWGAIPGLDDIFTAPSEVIQATLPTIRPISPPGDISTEEYELLMEILGVEGVIAIFGDSGGGKTKWALSLTQQAKRLGKKCGYIDTEKNLMPHHVRGFHYEFIRTFEALMARLKDTLPKEHYDWIVVDSITIFMTKLLGIIKEYRRNMLYQQIQSMFGLMVDYCDLHHATCILVLQPASRMNQGGAQPILAPMSDKGEFLVKNTLYINSIYASDGSTVSRILQFYKARDFADNTILSTLAIDDHGAHMDTSRLRELRDNLANR